MTSGTRVSSQSTHTCCFTFGGLCWLTMSSGSSRPVTNAKSAKHAASRFLQLYLLWADCSGGSILILCSCLTQAGVNTLFKHTVLWLLTWNGICCNLNPLPFSHPSSSRTSSVDGGAISEIITNNGHAFIEALYILASRYNVPTFGSVCITPKPIAWLNGIITMSRKPLSRAVRVWNFIGHTPYIPYFGPSGLLSFNLLAFLLILWHMAWSHCFPST